MSKLAFHSNPRKAIWQQLVLALLLSLAFVGIFLGVQNSGVQPGHAQTETTAWAAPENLSNSGAASQPRILAGPGEILQAFWIDHFDGLITSVFDGKAWSSPQPAPIFADSTVSSFLNQMPFLIADQSGWVHAFWQSATPRPLSGGQSFSAESLFHSKLPAGGTSWTTPELLAEDALTYSVYASVDGGLTLAYIRRLQTDSAPAGVYVRRLPAGPTSWQPSVNVYASIYYRLLTPGAATITAADDGDGNVFTIWNDPKQNQTFSASSEDDGQHWADPEIFSDQANGDPTPSALRITALPGQVLSIWQTLSSNNCSLYQQEWGSSADEQLAWGSPTRIFANLGSCPTGDSLWPQVDQEQFYWLWGQGASSLSLSAWDPGKEQWSIPVNQTFSFENPAGSGMIILSDLHATISNNRTAVVGFDPSGEVWAIRAEKSVPDFVYAPQPAWEPAQPVTSSDQAVGEFTLAMDESGRAHLIYTRPADTAVTNQSPLGAAIIYTYAGGTAGSTAGEADNLAAGPDQIQTNQVEIFPGVSGELTRQPALLADNPAGFLHLVWSGQEQGNILYSRAPLDKADSPGEWFPSQTLSGAALASWPQIGMDAAGRLYVLYAIALNEERGIYLTTSEDHGETWSIAKQIFDAAAAGLQGVERPTLYVEPAGVLHAAWVETAPAGNAISQGIFYTSSIDSGKTWSEPIILAGEGNDWPKLAAADNQLHLTYVQNTCLDCSHDQNGQPWERIMPIQETPSEPSSLTASSRWSTAVRLPGWGEISLPYGIASDGSLEKGSLHLAGINPQNGTITYSTWRDGSWSAPESFSPGNTIALAPAAGLGLQAATKPDGELLAIAWLSAPQNLQERTAMVEPALSFTRRRIDPVDLPLAPTAQPTQTPTPLPAPTATISLPTPTPDLNLIPPPSSTAQTPLIMSAAVVGLFVAGFFVWRLVRSRRK